MLADPTTRAAGYPIRRRLGFGNAFAAWSGLESGPGQNFDMGIFLENLVIVEPGVLRKGGRTHAGVCQKSLCGWTGAQAGTKLETGVGL